MALNSTNDVVWEQESGFHDDGGVEAMGSADENGEFNFDFLNDSGFDLDFTELERSECDVNPAVKYINQKLSMHKNKVLFGHVNARSLPNSIHEISYILSQTDFDCFEVAETWLAPNTPSDRVHIEGFTIHRNDRKNSRGGGVALYVKNNYKSRKIKTPLEVIVPENLWVEVDIGKTKIAVGVLYKPPKIPYTIFSNLIECFIGIYSKYEHVVLLGDFNTDLTNLDSAPAKFLFENFIDPLSLKQTINKPTRIAKNSSTLLDLIIVNDPKNVAHSDCTEVGGISDHHLVFAAMTFKKPKFKPYTVTTRDFKNVVWPDFNDDLEAFPWENTLGVSYVNTKVCIFENYITELLDKHAPYRTFRITKKNSTPWISDEIKGMMNGRDSRKIKFNQTGNPIYFDDYKKIRNKVTKMRRKAFGSYIHKNLNSKIKKSKDFYKAARQLNIIPNKKTRSPINFSANKLNKAFTENNNFCVDENKIDEQIRKMYQKNPPTLHKFKFREVTELEIVKTITGLKTNSSGVDGINSFILKLIVKRVSHIILDIIQTSFRTKTFPERWKFAIISPIPKNDHPFKETDFRPISLLCALSKVLEKMANKQICEYLIKHSFLDVHQSAYRPNHGCITALLKVVDDILDGIDDSEATLLILLDFSKAFDTINHRLLLEKLSILGFEIDALEWVKSYLTGRKQQVRTENETSDFIELKNGVPQGSILGPLLFTIFVLDIRQHIEVGSHHSYADDLQIYKSFKSPDINETIISLNKDLKNIAEYCDNSALKINEGKCYYLILGSSRSLQKIPYMPHVPVIINGIPIKRVYKIRNLGITFDEVLSWRRHINSRIQVAMGNYIAISRFKNFLSEESKLILCESIVLSHFNFGDSVFLNIDKYLQGRIQRIQNICLRFIFGIRKKSKCDYDELRSRHKILDMNQRRILHGLTSLFKVLKNHEPSYLADFFTQYKEIRTRNTRICDLNIYQPDVQISSIHSRAFKFYIPRVWNLLPGDIKAANTLNTFKIKVKKLLLTNNLEIPAL